MNRLDARRLTPVWCCLQHAQRKLNEHARLLTKEIQGAREAAVWSLRCSNSDSAQLTGVADQFFQRMLKLCDSSDLDYIHVSAMIHSTAVVWETSDATLASELQQEHAAQCCRDAQRCLAQLLPRLEAMLGVLGAQAASNTLWSFVKLGLDPDAVCPGITIELLQRVADDQFTTAQTKANTVWAMAILQGFTKISDAAKRFVYRLCSHFVKHVSEPFKRNSATAQNVCRGSLH